MKILVMGAGGFIGGGIKSVLKNAYDVIGTYYNENGRFTDDKSMLNMDISRPESIESALIKSKADIVISSLRGDFAQQAAAHRVTAEYLRASGGRLIYISSLNVFDDIEKRRKPNYEDDAPKAESAYGKHKIECENITRSILGDSCVIIRIPPVYARDCPRLKALADARPPVRVCEYTGIEMNYTTTGQIAAYIGHIIKNELTGVFHVGTSDTRDYYRFQLDLIEALGIPKPEFEVTEEKEKTVQAVLSDRKDIPDSLCMTVDELIMSLAGGLT